MIRLAITTHLRSRNEKLVWFPCEIDDLSTIEQVFERLKQDRMLLVKRFDTHVSDGVRSIVGEHSVIVGLDGISTITPLDKVLSDLSDARRPAG